MTMSKWKRAGAPRAGAAENAQAQRAGAIFFLPPRKGDANVFFSAYLFSACPQREGPESPLRPFLKPHAPRSVNEPEHDGPQKDEDETDGQKL
jgi:hypothetical protein